ncbi:MAG: HAD hydrolase family protein [Proteobacteria bacterium]|nr:HAD hydrolase family protein [Pseudomonadota bacterium]MBU1686055.1 HAD hydrolase family protein [Pseudomonadota bacterium]
MSGNDSCPPGANGYPSDCELTQGLRERAFARQDEVSRGYAWKANLTRAAAIQLLLLDVDGVLTDGSLIFLPDGSEIKAFSSKDGFGLRLVKEAGVEVGIITARTSAVVQRRAENLGITRLYQGRDNKLEVFSEILAETGLTNEQIAYVGDDWLDLPILSRVGLAVSVADGTQEVRERVHYVTRAMGGRGAVREVCDLLIEAKGRRNELLGRYLPGGG